MTGSLVAQFASAHSQNRPDSGHTALPQHPAAQRALLEGGPVPQDRREPLVQQCESRGGRDPAHGGGEVSGPAGRAELCCVERRRYLRA